MGNRRVRVMWADLNGLSHGRYVPRARLLDHGHHAVTTLTMGINRDILPVDGYGPDVGFADLTTVPLAESVRPGWEIDTDVAIAGLEYNGQPLALCQWLRPHQEVSHPSRRRPSASVPQVRVPAVVVAS